MRDSDPADPSRASAEPQELLDHAERIGVFGSWEWTPDTGELRWSDNLFRLFGLEPGSITPSIAYLLDHVHPADRAGLETALDALADRNDPNTIAYRIVRDDDVVRRFCATLAFVVEDEGGAKRLVGSILDVTSQDSLSRKLAAHAAVSKALDEWQEFDAGAKDLLVGVAIAMNLSFATLWVPQDGSLLAKVVWHVESAPLAELADARLAWRPGPGSPTLGRAWQDRHPLVSNQPAVGVPKEHASAMQDAAVGAVIAVPAVAGDETLAVLEFLSIEPIEPTDRLFRALNGIGHEVGYFLGQRRGELLAPVLTPREIEVLQLAARALSASEIAEEMHVSPATVKRHFEDAYARLGVSDRAAAVAHAMRQGLIS